MIAIALAALACAPLADIEAQLTRDGTPYAIVDFSEMGAGGAAATGLLVAVLGGQVVEGIIVGACVTRPSRSPLYCRCGRADVPKAARGTIYWRTAPWFNVVRYAFCPDPKAWAKAQKLAASSMIEIGPYPQDQSALTTFWKSKTGATYSLVTVGSAADEDPIHLVNALAHESVHVASAIFEEMKETKPGEEVFAYFVGGITADLFTDYALTRSPNAVAGMA